MKAIQLAVSIFLLMALPFCGKNPKNPVEPPDENGGEIAFRVGGILYVMDLITGSTWIVTESLWGSFRLSPDGEWIVFEEGAHIYRIKVNGDSLAQLTFQGRNFSPPGDLMGSGSRMTQILTTQNMFGSRFIG